MRISDWSSDVCSSDLAIPDPVPAIGGDKCSLVVTGIGGTGVVTIGAIIGMAAHLDGKAVRVMDMTGLAQKGGAVVSPLPPAPNADDIRASKISSGAADPLLVCGLVVGALPDNLGRLSPGADRVMSIDHESITGAFNRDTAIPF